MLLALVTVLAAAPTWQVTKPEARVEALAQLQSLPLGDRLTQISERFVGTPYTFSPLGEGEGHDADPLLRFDAVDCLTFVETAMAMALAPDEAALLPTLNSIRYEKGTVGWATRNHITEAQWVPNNVAAGVLKEVTPTLGKTVEVKKVLTEAVWALPEGKSLALTEEQQLKGTFSLNVIPSTQVLEAVKNAPSGLVAVVVRADRPKSVTRVSHVGFVIQTAKGPVLRHASRSFKKVTDEPLERYLKRNRDFGEWTIAGIAFFEVTPPPKT